MITSGDVSSDSPVTRIATDPRDNQPQPGTSLCLSGGGYRAMLFHLGAVCRLNEFGYLPRIDRISSVSGGSIIAALLGLHWSKLEFDAHGVGHGFEAAIVTPIRNLASTTIDIWAVLKGAFLPGSVGEKVANAYKKTLFGTATLQDLPDTPRFILNATNVQSGVLFRFSKPYAWDYQVGKIERPTIPLAQAVAASSAFPPVLSPLVLRFNSAQFEANTGDGLQRPPYTTRVVLTDGGVYDNLGLETAYKNYQTVLASDGGGKMQPDAKPGWDWIRHSIRVNGMIDNQVRSLRKRQLIDALKNGSRTGTYWGIRTNIEEYGLGVTLPCPHERTLQLAATPTRLKKLPAETQERLINWGYAVCDAAMRRHVNPNLPLAKSFKYPSVRV